MKLPSFPPTAAWGALLGRPAGLALRGGPSALAGGVLSRTPAVPIPLACWLPTRSHGAVAGASPAAPEKVARAHRPPAVLVKLGEAGLYSLVRFPKILDMDRMSLLKMLRRDDGFAVTLRDVPLSQCTAHVCASTSEEAPSAAEAAAASALVGIKTLRTLAASMAAAQPGAHLFVRVALPAGSSAAAAVHGELGRPSPPLPAPIRLGPRRSHWLGGTRTPSLSWLAEWHALQAHAPVFPPTATPATHSAHVHARHRSPARAGWGHAV